VKRVILAGGGLANVLIAMRLHALRPELNVTLVESCASVGGNHTWSFFESDFEASTRAWLEPLVVARWPAYQVAFPEYSRRLQTGYASVSSERLNLHLSSLARENRLQIIQASVLKCTSHEIFLENGMVLEAETVIDGRGFRAHTTLRTAGQKFMGQVLLLEADHGLTEPCIMDARVEQIDGYRFFYLLPFDDRRILVEDTRYTENLDLDRPAIRSEISAYVAKRGWHVRAIEREEEGVLPIVLDGDIQAFQRDQGVVAVSGVRAALFHATTGYSLPYAARMAERIAGLIPLSSAAAAACSRAYAAETWRAQGFYRLLNRLMFDAAEPASRYRILQRFYTLPRAIVERLYAGNSTYADRIRILLGKPPVPIPAALRVLLNGKK
jgi:lycopene beta-cyclase